MSPMSPMRALTDLDRSWNESEELCDVLGKIETEITKFLPWQCVAFAGDVSECYVARHHFVEQTGKVRLQAATGSSQGRGEGVHGV